MKPTLEKLVGDLILSATSNGAYDGRYDNAVAQSKKDLTLEIEALERKIKRLTATVKALRSRKD